MESLASENLDQTHRIKVVFLGDKGVGKSSIIKRYISNKFQTSPKSTIGMDFFCKKLKHNGKNFKIQLWDTAGQQQFKSLIKNYIRNADAYIYVYDCSNPQTFCNISSWVETVNQINQKNSFSLIAGNKADLQFNTLPLQTTKVQKLKSQKYLKDFQQFKVSAKLGNNVYELINRIIEQFDDILDRQKKSQSNTCLGKIQILSSSYQHILMQSQSFLQKKRKCC